MALAPAGAGREAALLLAFALSFRPSVQVFPWLSL